MASVCCESLSGARVLLAGHGGPVVVVPVFEAYDDLVRCLESVLRHSADDTDVLVVDDGSTDPRIAALGERLAGGGPRVLIVRQPENRGFVRTMNDAFAAAGDRDVVMLNSDVIVGPGWLERLQAAAYADSRIATATPLTNYGTIVSVPERNAPGALPPGTTPEAAAVAVAAASSGLRPLLPTCIGHCVYVKRMALDLVGAFDEAFSPGYGEEVDWSQRGIAMGLAHVCADDVFVFHRGRGSFGQRDEGRRLQAAHDDIVRQRYPYYERAVELAAGPRNEPLARAIANGRRALLGLTVVVDATCLGPVLMGTQRVVLESIRALGAHAGVGRVVAVVPDEPGPYVHEALAGLERVRTVRAGAADRLAGDVVYRPVQLYTLAELERLRRWGERTVVLSHDLILFHTPTYHPRPDVWEHFRDLQRLAFAAADGLAFVSEHAAREAREAGLLRRGQPARVVHNGLDHFEVAASAAPPALLPSPVVAGGFVLCLGTDYRHKNRPFALRVFAAMVAQGYDGHLVLAGHRVADGSSRAAEAEILLEHRRLADRVLALAVVPEDVRAWLYAHADLVLFPTLYEGFGLVPFEAARAGTPCLSSAQTALDEVLPADIERIERFDADAVAAQALAIVRDPARGRRIVDGLRAQAVRFTWGRTADRLVELFDDVLRTTTGPAVAAVAGERGPIGAVPSTEDPLQALLRQMYPPEFHELLRAIGQRRHLRSPLVRATLRGYRVASSLRSVLARARGRSAAANGDAS